MLQRTCAIICVTPLSLSSGRTPRITVKISHLTSSMVTSSAFRYARRGTSRWQCAFGYVVAVVTRIVDEYTAVPANSTSFRFGIGSSAATHLSGQHGTKLARLAGATLHRLSRPAFLFGLHLLHRLSSDELRRPRILPVPSHSLYSVFIMPRGFSLAQTVGNKLRYT